VNFFASLRLDKQWGVGFIILIAMVTWGFVRAIEHRDVDRRLTAERLPNTRRQFWPFGFLRGFDERRLIGRTWLLEGMQQSLVMVGAMLSVLIIARVGLSAQAAEAARGGALLTIAALVSVFIGYHEETVIHGYWQALAAGATNPSAAMVIRREGEEAVTRARKRSQQTALWLGVIGTFVWAYGDQVTGCGIFPVLGIQDASRVTCFEKTP